jgi:hypothetical protein
LLQAGREVGLEVNTEKSKYMLVSHHQNVGQNHNFLTVNKSFKNVAKFKYFRATVANQNNIKNEIKRKLNCRNACYHSGAGIAHGIVLGYRLDDQG